MTVREYLSRLMESPTWWTCVGLCVAYGILTFSIEFLPQYVFERASLIVVGGFIVVRYIPGVLQALIAPRFGGGEQLALGAWLTWCALLELAVWGLLRQLLDRPDWMEGSRWVCLIGAQMLAGGILHLSSPDADEFGIPSGNYWHIAFSFVLGGVVTYILLATDFGRGIIPVL